jgi:hypothetical protein
MAAQFLFSVSVSVKTAKAIDGLPVINIGYGCTVKCNVIQALENLYCIFSSE